ncbi:hypothetical protein GCM10009836_56920 [Pseudonocardia ailaonensis]|uniref:DUF742 domain-containing protein n=1 Tax=Pseudonocardia ailaonensis TaxID=367279 RepID=A0ABN2NH26_9PSEU
MTSGPDDPRRQQEPTFADVMNGLTLDSGRPRKRRRWGRRRPEDELTSPSGDSGRHELPPAPGDAGFAGSGYGNYQTGPIDRIPDDPLPLSAPTGAAAVRPYAWTRGRTKTTFDLAIETLVSTSASGRDQLHMLQMEHRSVAELCDRPRSVAEVAALLSLPLGVARVLLGDMAGLGVMTVHQTASTTGNLPDLALMERVLSGLRRL